MNMKKYLLMIVAAALCLYGCQTQECNRVIPTPTPERPAGQTDVLELACAPIPIVRVAFIGLGRRGPGAVSRMTHIPGVEIIA